MRIAILSDIHANSFAFKAVLRSKEIQITDLRINVGDSIGYFLDPAFVIENLQSNAFISIRGNHEEMLATSLINSTFATKLRTKYGISFDFCREELSHANLEFLQELPDFLRIDTGDGILYVYHGTPKGNHYYFYPDSPAAEIESDIPDDCKWLILGNTHWPMIRYIGKIIVINPGSVGQPRNGQLGANWAILDTNSASVSFLCTSYPESNSIQQLEILSSSFSSQWKGLGKP